MIPLSYTTLIQYASFEDRFRYLRQCGRVGEDTFGYNRIFNQRFYHSKEWKDIRDVVILRDNACDLAHPDYEIHGHVYIHHLNPITLDDLQNGADLLLNPDNLVCVSKRTHDAIHYGGIQSLPQLPTERTPGDTCPWR